MGSKADDADDEEGPALRLMVEQRGFADSLRYWMVRCYWLD